MSDLRQTLEFSVDDKGQLKNHKAEIVATRKETDKLAKSTTDMERSVDDAFSDLRKRIEETSTRSREFSESVRKSNNASAGSFTALGKTIKGVGVTLAATGILAILSAIIAAAVGIGKAFQKVGEAGGETGAKFQKLTESFGKVAEFLENTFAGVVVDVIDLLNELVAWAEDSGFASTMGKVIEGVAVAFRGLIFGVSQIPNAFQLAFNAVVGTVQGSIGLILDALGGLFEKVGDIPKILSFPLKSFGIDTKAFEEAGSKLTEVSENFSKQSQKNFGEVGDSISAIGSDWDEFTAKLGKKIDLTSAEDVKRILTEMRKESDNLAKSIEKIRFERVLDRAGLAAPFIKELASLNQQLSDVERKIVLDVALGIDTSELENDRADIIAEIADVHAELQNLLDEINNAVLEPLEVEITPFYEQEKARQQQKKLQEVFDRLGIDIEFPITLEPPNRSEIKATLDKMGLDFPQLRQLSPAMQKLLDDGEDLDAITGSVLDNFADMGRAILDAADSFGDLSEEVKGFANGILNAVDNFANLRQKVKDGIGGAALLTPTIGIAAGALTAINSLIKSREENSERMRELSMQLRDAERGIARTVNDLLTAGRIGGDTSGEDVRDSLAAIARLVNSNTGLLPEFRTPRNPDDLDVNDAFLKALQNFEDLFDELEDLGAIDIEQFRDQFEGLVNSEGLNQAVLKTFYGPLGLITQLEGLSEDLGGFGESVTGAINKLDFFSSFLGTEGNAGAALFIEELRKLEGLPLQVTDFLDQIEEGIAGGIDLSSADGQDFLNGLIELLAGQAQGADFFGSLTPSELEDIFNAFRGLAGGSDSVEALSNGIGDALDSFRLFSRFIETDLQEQFDRLFDEVLNSGAAFSDELVDILKEAQALDLGTQKGRDRLQEIIAGLTEGLISGVDFGIPEEQLEELLGLLQGLGAEAGSDDETTARQIISRIITEVTANELVVLDNERNFILKDIRDDGRDRNRILLNALSAHNDSGLFGTGSVTNIFNNSFDIQIAQAQNVDQMVESLETEIRRRMTGGFSG